MRTLAVAALALVLVGCGGAREHGTATLWVTRDRGAHVLYTGTVPAGLTALQALDRRTTIETRYGGRFVQSINGVAGNVDEQRDWFYFVNGIEASKGAADVRLRPGDIEWWDYRSWRGRAMSVPVVVGAFPEPFLHGFDGVEPGAVVVASRPADAVVASELADATGGVAEVGTARTDLETNVVEIDARAHPATSSAVRRGRRVVLTLGIEAARALAADPDALRFRYGVAE